jgi:hypothetical protein
MKDNRAGQLMNVFHPDEIQSLKSSLCKLKDTKNTGREFKAYTNGIRSTDLIYPFIKKKVLDRIETLLNRPINLTQGMLLKENTPWKIHTDYLKYDTTPDLGILIPLNNTMIDTYTVIFNECCTTNFDEYILNNPKLINNATNIYSNLMSHETVERLEYVSLLGSFSWVPGSLIYWDRKLLHASDNFLKNNLTEKTALVLFTNLD